MTRVGITALDRGHEHLLGLRVSLFFQEYSAALQQTLAHDYTAGSQHAKWTTALAACLAAHAQSLQADGNMETIQVCLRMYENISGRPSHDR